MLVDIGEIFTSLQVTTKQTPPTPPSLWSKLTLCTLKRTQFRECSSKRIKVPKDWYTHISSCLSRDNLNPIARIGKWRVLAFARLHPWFGWGGGGGGGGWEFAVPFYSVQESKIATLGASLCAWPKMSSSWGQELTLTRTFWKRKYNYILATILNY